MGFGGMLKRVVVALALVALVTPALAEAVGPPFQVNTYKTESQDRPSVAALRGGGFVATWESLHQDGSYYGIYGQMFDRSGQRVGREFRVNTEWPGQQFGSKVTAFDDGGFLVTWYSQYTGGRGWGMHGQRYDSAGNRLGHEFRISSQLAGFKNISAVAQLANGGFVAVWAKTVVGQDDLLFARRFDASITPRPVGTPILIGGTTQDPIGWDNAKVAGLKGGGFVVVWLTEYPDRIFARQYNSSGISTRSWTVASSSEDGLRELLRDPNVVALKDGSFVITWVDNTMPAARNHIYGQRYTSKGDRVGHRFQIDTVGVCLRSAVASLPDGGFVAVYRVHRVGSGDVRDSVFGQRYDQRAKRVGGEFVVHRNAVANNGPAVAGLRDNGFVVLWTGVESNYFEDYHGIFGQQFSP